jgi:hypothetical protein
MALPKCLLWTSVVVAGVATWSSLARAADPTTADCLAASLASLKLGNEHKVRQERAQLLVCAADSCPGDIRRECARRVDEVNGAIPTIIFAAKDATHNDLSAVKVTMDGEVLAERLEGTALSIDPGQHVFVFETPGFPGIEKHFVIQQGQKDRREQVVFGAAAGEPAPDAVTPSPSPSGPPPTVDPRPSPAEPAAEHDESVKRIIGYSLIGLGAVGVGVAIGEQVTALGRASDSSNAAASPDPGVQANAGTLHNQAVQAQAFAAIFGVAGVASAGVGVFLVLTAHGTPSTPKAATPRVVPEIGPRSASLALDWAW